MKKEIVNKKTLFILILVGLLMVIGSTFALYNFVIKGQKENTISTARISFSYAEPLDSLSLTSYNILTDLEGTQQEDYYEFSVKGTSSLAQNLNYIIYMSKINSDYNFSESDLKINLTSVTSNIETQVLSPILISNLPNYNSDKYLYHSSFIFDGADLNEQIHTYRLRIWLKDSFSINDLLTTTTIDGEQNIKLEEYQYRFKINVGIAKNLDESGANAPELVTGMIPVYYDSTNDVWRKADSTNLNNNYQWYSYLSSGTTKGMWANAVTVLETSIATSLTLSNGVTMPCDSTNCTRNDYINSSVGTIIPIEDINTMWVWIPRFNAITPSNYNGGTALNPGAIDVTFVNTITNAHDAFWWDENSDGVVDEGEQKKGFWFAKFENSAPIIPTASSTTQQAPIIKPNLVTWRYGNIVTFYNSIKNNMNGENGLANYGLSTGDTYDAHMIKNNEWAAMSYLTQSIYGRCSNSVTCTEVTRNNCSLFITGIGGDIVDSAASNTTCTTPVNQYNGATGVLASTTGTVYGIYDTNGGTWEYVMGNYNNEAGSGGLTMTGVESKYKNIYTTAAAYTSAGLQHSIVEIQGWNNDNYAFVTSSNEFFARSGWHGTTPSVNITGTFYTTVLTGSASSNGTTRVTIVK